MHIKLSVAPIGSRLQSLLSYRTTSIQHMEFLGAPKVSSPVQLSVSSGGVDTEPTLQYHHEAKKRGSNTPYDPDASPLSSPLGHATSNITLGYRLLTAMTGMTITCWAELNKSSYSGLRTGHCRLKRHMYQKLKIAPTPYCQCGQVEQTVSHILQDCPLLDQLRRTTWPEGAIVRHKLWGCRTVHSLTS